MGGDDRSGTPSVSWRYRRIAPPHSVTNTSLTVAPVASLTALMSANGTVTSTYSRSATGSRLKRVDGPDMGLVTGGAPAFLRDRLSRIAATDRAVTVGR